MRLEGLGTIQTVRVREVVVLSGSFLLPRNIESLVTRHSIGDCYRLSLRIALMPKLPDLARDPVLSLLRYQASSLVYDTLSVCPCSSASEGSEPHAMLSFLPCMLSSASI